MDLIDKEYLRTDRNALVGLLSSLGAQVRGSSLKCPFHDDQHPSAQIRRSSQTGAWYFYCYVCSIADDYYALRSRIEGLPVGDILKSMNPSKGEGYPNTQPRPAPQHPPRHYYSIKECVAAVRKRYPLGIIDEVNPYTNPDTGIAELVVIRYRPEGATSKKQFAQFSRNGTGWIAKGIASPAPLPLFNRIRLKEADTVLVVEGEKCVRALTKYLPANIAATTVPGGASSAGRGQWEILQGKRVYIWPDNDEPGRGYGEAVAKICHSLGCSVSIVKIDQGEKEDAADYIERLIAEGKSGDEITSVLTEILLEHSLPYAPSNIIRQHIKDIYEGKYAAIDFHGLPILSTATRALLPGTITILVSEPGVGKSWFLLQQCWQMLEQGIHVKLLMLEEDKKFHLMRALTQFSGKAEIVDTEYVKNNAMYVNALYEKHAPDLDRLSVHLTAAGSSPYTLDEVREWCQAQATAGARVIIVDPITVAMTSDKPWLADLEFIMAVKKIAEQHSLSVILSTHPRMGAAGKPSLSGMAGGGAYPRFAQTVLWMRRHDPPTKATYYTIAGTPHTDNVSRTLQVQKARNGPGGGVTIAIRLNHNSLMFEELGLVRSSEVGG